MFKVVTIDNKKIPMKSNGYTGRLYARFFSKDFLKSIFELEKIDKNNKLAIKSNVKLKSNQKEFVIV